MVSGQMPCSARSARILSASAALTGEGFHWRGDEENIWKQLAPQSTARCTAVHVPPLVERWMPMRLVAVPAAMISMVAERLPCETW